MERCRALFTRDSLEAEALYEETTERLKIKWVSNVIKTTDRFYEVSLVDRDCYEPIWCEKPKGDTEKLFSLDRSLLLPRMVDLIIENGAHFGTLVRDQAAERRVADMAKFSRSIKDGL
ncbi:MAG: hypothetical protein ABIJ34_01425 [archaeon]